MRKVEAIRYIKPLREGGSLPAIVEANDGCNYVIKFKGAGHGTKMLISELIGGQIAKVLGFNIPELVFIELDESFGRLEADEELQDLLQASVGLNIGMKYLSSAFTYDPVAWETDELLASKLLWLDSFITNIDRTVKNTNLLIWNKDLWLIDQGASLYFHHSWTNWEEASKSKFPMSKDHVMLTKATHIKEVDEEFRSILTDDIIDQIVDLIPSVWLEWTNENEAENDIKKVYKTFLKERLRHSVNFVNEIINARKAYL